MHDETYIEILEDEIWVNGNKVRIEPGSLFIQNDDDVNKPLRVSVTFLPDSLTIRREQKPPEEKPVIDYSKIPIHAGLHEEPEKQSGK